MSSFFRWLWSGPKAESEWGRFVSKFFNRILLVFILFIIALIGLNLANNSLNTSRIPLYLGIILVNLIVLALHRLKKTRSAMHLFIWSIFLLNITGSFATIGIYTPAYFILCLLILVSALGLSPRSTQLLTFCIIASGLIMLFGHQQGWIKTPSNYVLSPLAMWITLSSIFVSLSYALISLRSTSFSIAERLEREQSFYRAIVEDQNEFIVRWKPNGIRTFANSAYLRYFGLTREEAVGTSFFPQINEDDRKWISEKIARLSLENPVDLDEHRVIRPDGSQGWQAWSDRAIFDNNGRIIEYQSVGRDITAAKELEERQRELDLAKEREAFLQDFLSTMSHDLQTPLSSMRANLYMLQKSPEKSEERIAKIDRQIDKLSSMIEDILTAARLEHLPELERRPLDLDSLLESSLSPLREEARVKNIEIISPQAPSSAFIKGDAKELQRALSNLISNAIKYTSNDGKVSIEIGQSPEHIHIHIIDTGIGIDEQDLPFVFDRFFRAKNARNFEKGTGLGLPIVKRIIELHEGTIQASSQLGQGSRFSVQLPLLKEPILI